MLQEVEGRQQFSVWSSHSYRNAACPASLADQSRLRVAAFGEFASALPRSTIAAQRRAATLRLERALLIIGVGRRPLVVQEVSCTELRGNRLELNRRVSEVETIGQVVCWPVRVSERRKTESSLDVFKDTAEIVRYV